MEYAPIVCLYHKHCVDGTTAAAVVLKRYPNAQTFPIGFDTAGADLAAAKAAIFAETVIIYVDNSIGLAELAALGNKIIVLDHHISEREKITALTEVYSTVSYTFKQEESGASLAWQYFFPEEEMPTLIAYVRDIDIWKQELLPTSEEVHLYLSQYRDNPAAVTRLLGEDETKIRSAGSIISGYVEHEVADVIKRNPVHISVPGVSVSIPCFNITNHQSMAGNLLSQQLGKAVVLYTISGEMVRLSIRSVEGQNPSALMVAAALGGGGHECSSGARVSRDYFFSLCQK